MPERALSNEAAIIEQWVEHETRHLDLVASWETLCSVYDVLRFIDPISDKDRLIEFKWIITEINKFLTRVRNKTATMHSINAVVDFLKKNANSQPQVDIKTRESLALNKLRQQWVMQNIMHLIAIEQELIEREDTDE